MGVFGQVFIGLLICFIEMIFLLYFLDEMLDLENWIWLIYSIIILAINLIPVLLIAKGEPWFWVNSAKTIFAVSFVSAVCSVVVFGIISAATGDCEDGIFSLIGVHFVISVILLFVLIVIGYMYVDSSWTPLDTNEYVVRYEVVEENERPCITYISKGENVSGYYVIMYKVLDETGEVSIRVLQASQKDVSIVYAVEESDMDYLYIYTTEHVSVNRNVNPAQTKTEKTYKYKLIVQSGKPIISLLPSFE